MVSPNQKVPSWLKTENGTPRFTTTNDAIFYARLVYDDNQAICELNFYYAALREKMKKLPHKNESDLNDMMHVAVQAQFFRECLDEVNRIRKEL